MKFEKQFRDAFPDIDQAAVSQLVSNATAISAPAGTEVFHVGDECEQFYFMLKGIIRVQLVSGTGREIVLYRVNVGDTCVLTTACLLGNVAYNAEAIAETDIEAISVPRTTFFSLMENSESFRSTVFALFAKRLSNIVLLLEHIAFRGIDARLAEFLSANSSDGVVTATHNEIAANLGTAREVVGRHLKAFAADGLITVNPGKIMIADPEGLGKLAGAA